MSAFKMDSVLESAVKPFADFGNEVGRALKSLPGVIPIPGSN